MADTQRNTHYTETSGGRRYFPSLQAATQYAGEYFQRTGNVLGVFACEPRARYQVVVGNIGTVYDGGNLRDARFHARTYVDQSKSGRGRAGGEDVTILRDTGGDAEVIEEYRGTLSSWEDRDGDA